MATKEAERRIEATIAVTVGNHRPTLVEISADIEPADESVDEFVRDESVEMTVNGENFALDAHGAARIQLAFDAFLKLFREHKMDEF